MSMPDYQAYREHAGLSNAEFIVLLQVWFPKFSKVDASFLAHPDEHGLCLTKEAEHRLVEACGPGPGLEHIPYRPGLLERIRRKK